MRDFRSKVLGEAGLAAQLEAWRAAGARIVFTNGCFDILHLGHATYLNEARKLGGVLVVGLNSDASVRQLKGPERPVNPWHARAGLLAALECVDAVVEFDTPTPYELIQAVQPDVLVKGGDYTPSSIVGADIVRARGGEVAVIDLVEGFSTTAIVKKLKA